MKSSTAASGVGYAFFVAAAAASGRGGEEDQCGDDGDRRAGVQGLHGSCSFGLVDHRRPPVLLLLPGSCRRASRSCRRGSRCSSLRKRCSTSTTRTGRCSCCWSRGCSRIASWSRRRAFPSSAASWSRRRAFPSSAARRSRSRRRVFPRSAASRSRSRRRAFPRSAAIPPRPNVRGRTRGSSRPSSRGRISRPSRCRGTTRLSGARDCATTCRRLRRRGRWCRPGHRSPCLPRHGAPRPGLRGCRRRR